MRKSTIFISSVLTTFALVVLFGVVKAYQGNAQVQQTETATQSVVPTAMPTDTPTAAPLVVTPEEAAQLAAQVVGHTNLLSAETSNFNGVPAYLITFTNKDMVYVGLDGQILSVQIAPVFVEVAPPVKNTKHNNDNTQNNTQNNNQTSGNDEGHDD